MQMNRKDKLCIKRTCSSTHLGSFGSFWAGSTLGSCWSSISFGTLNGSQKETNHTASIQTYIHMYVCCVLIFTIYYVLLMCTHTAGPWGPVTPRFPLGPSIPYVHTCVVKTMTSAMYICSNLFANSPLQSRVSL